MKHAPTLTNRDVDRAHCILRGSRMHWSPWSSDRFYIAFSPCPRVVSMGGDSVSSVPEGHKDYRPTKKLYNQIKLCALALDTDILFLDAPSNLARYMERGAGNVTCLSEVQCRSILHGRRHDQIDPLRIIKYTPGHYAGVCWPQPNE